MASFQSRMINRSLKSMVHGMFSHGLKLDKLRVDDHYEPGPLARRKSHIETFQLGDIKGYILSPKHSTPDNVILYFHGGAYVSGPSLLHWRLISHLSRKGNYTIYFIDYPKAPEHPYPAALNVMERVYSKILENYESQKVIFMGDSAGGGLALSLAMRMRDENRTLPRKIVLLSPWLDLSMNQEGIEEQAELDHMLALPGLAEAANYYRGTEGATHPYISPFFGDLHDLPPLFMQVGTFDILLLQCRQFAERAKEQDLDIHYEEWQEMFHVWMLNTPYLPEANDAVNKVLKWLKD